LKQAADKERITKKENIALQDKLKLILEVNPKTPSEALAKELRQARLTIERINCENKEMKFKLSSKNISNFSP